MGDLVNAPRFFTLGALAKRKKTGQRNGGLTVMQQARVTITRRVYKQVRDHTIRRGADSLDPNGRKLLNLPNP